MGGFDRVLGRSTEAVAHGAKHYGPTARSFMKVASSIQKRKMVHFYCGASFFRFYTREMLYASRPLARSGASNISFPDLNASEVSTPAVRTACVCHSGARWLT